MNLLNHERVREFRQRCGNVIPGTNTFETIPPMWSPPKLLICSDKRSERVEADVIRLFKDPDYHVVSVSPATVTATPEVSSYSGNPTGYWGPHFVVTVIYQDRIAWPEAKPESEAA